MCITAAAGVQLFSRPLRMEHVHSFSFCHLLSLSNNVPSVMVNTEAVGGNGAIAGHGRVYTCLHTPRHCLCSQASESDFQIIWCFGSSASLLPPLAWLIEN